MPRNGAGIFGVKNPVIAGAARSSAAANDNFTDAGNEITNTLPVDGQAGMSGSLQLAAGKPAQPGLSWATDRNTGIYRSAPNELTWIAGAIARLRIGANGKAWFLGNVDVAGAIVINGAFSGSSDVGKLEAMSGVGLARRKGQNLWAQDAAVFDLPIRIGGNGIAVRTGVIGDLIVPCDCKLTAVTLLADQVGSCVVDIWRCTFDQYDAGSTHPVSGDSVTGASKPTLSAARKSEDTTLSTWTTSLSAGDVLRFNVNSASTITRLSVTLKARRF